MEEKKSLLDKLRLKYRLSIYRDTTFEEVVNFRLSRLNVFVSGGTLILLFIAFISVLISFTPLREFIPGYPDETTRSAIVMNKLRVDSLAGELEKRERYIENINIIINGGVPHDVHDTMDMAQSYEHISFTRSREDSIVREMFDGPSEQSLTGSRVTRHKGNIGQYHFFPPVRGMVTNTFNPNMNHYGTDIVAAANEVVKATLEGTVIMASWTLDTGWVIQIQHDGNIISVYKHNAELLKRVGDYVKVGEPIAIIGNSGELTTGPHIHFELWYNGASLNPEDYISF